MKFRQKKLKKDFIFGFKSNRNVALSLGQLRRKEFDEAEVLKKAMILFWKKGYNETSIKDLIQFLGISNASIYNIFGGKKELFNRAIDFYRTSNVKGLSHFISTQQDVRQGLKMVFEKIIQDDNEEDDRKGCFIVNTTELIPNDPEIQIVLDQHKLINRKIFL